MKLDYLSDQHELIYLVDVTVNKTNIHAGFGFFSRGLTKAIATLFDENNNSYEVKLDSSLLKLSQDESRLPVVLDLN